MGASQCRAATGGRRRLESCSVSMQMCVSFPLLVLYIFFIVILWWFARTEARPEEDFGDHYRCWGRARAVCSFVSVRGSKASGVRESLGVRWVGSLVVYEVVG